MDFSDAIKIKIDTDDDEDVDNEESKEKEKKIEKTEEEKKAEKKLTFLHKCIKGIVCLLLVIFIIITFIKRDKVSDYFIDFIAWLGEHPFLGAFYYIIICIVASIVLFPVVLLTIGSGYAFTQAT